MFLLFYIDEEYPTPWLSFETESEARHFVQQLPAYHHQSTTDEIGTIEEDWLAPNELPTYTEIEHNGHRIPLSKFMFRADQRVDLYITALPNLSQPGKGITEGTMLVDAYVVPNDEAAEYIASRERNFERVKQRLEELGHEVDRSFKGSEDGEAICYRKKGETDWHFLGHMDPLFAELKEEEIPNWIEEILQ